jgi:uncharacterized protein YndB with AHSA1/START domain
MENQKLVNRTINKERTINAAPNRVFQALSAKEDLERWFLVKADVELQRGGAIRFEWGPGMVNVGKVLELDAPSRFGYSWEAMEPTPTTITFELTEEQGGTRLRLIHSGIGEGDVWDQYYTAVNSGWDHHLSNLTAWVETGTCEPPEASSNR